MKNNSEPIEKLKLFLNLQLEAHINEDWETYDQLEKEIIGIEKEL